ncbi:hypothetical protein C8J56DRAFT_1109129 [Mycena floridula]|nr:hypothetical protein C8J56DRAFT_1109129 [Mycena floridula]
MTSLGLTCDVTLFEDSRLGLRLALSWGHVRGYIAEHLEAIKGSITNGKHGGRDLERLQLHDRVPSSSRAVQVDGGFFGDVWNQPKESHFIIQEGAETSVAGELSKVRDLDCDSRQVTPDFFCLLRLFSIESRTWTPGATEHRYQGKYRVEYNNNDSYPSGLDLEMKSEIPAAKIEFEVWLEKTGAWFDAEYEESLQLPPPADPDEGFHDSPLQNDVFIEWIYTIDLDNLIFHVQSHPVFRLDNMPNDDMFVSGLEGLEYLDCYGFSNYTDLIPHEHRYENQGPSILFNWRVMQHEDKIRKLDAELARLLVAFCLSLLLWGRDGFCLRICPDVEKEKDPNPWSKAETVELKTDNWWPATNICVVLTPQVQDEDSLRAAVVKLEEKITEPRTTPIFIILFSVWSVAIVQFTWKPGQSRPSIKHTKGMPFLPFASGLTPETEGVTALTCLGLVASRELIQLSLARVQDAERERLSPTWPLPRQERKQDNKSDEGPNYTHLYDVYSLRNFALVSEKTFEGALPIMILPHIPFRLVSPFVADADEEEPGDLSRFSVLVSNGITWDGRSKIVTLSQSDYTEKFETFHIDNPFGNLSFGPIRITLEDS